MLQCSYSEEILSEYMSSNRSERDMELSVGNVSWAQKDMHITRVIKSKLK